METIEQYFWGFWTINWLIKFKICLSFRLDFILLQTTSGKTNIFIEGSMFLLLGLGFINCLNYFDNFWLLINVSFLLFRVLLFTPIFPKFCQVRFSSRENKKKRSILEADLAIRSSIPGIMYNNQASEILVSKAMFDMSQY